MFYDLTIPAGKNWYKYIKQIFQNSSCVVVLWSSHSVESDFVLEEAHEAKRNDKLVPLLIDDIYPPLGFGTLHSLDFSDWSAKSAIANVRGPPTVHRRLHHARGQLSWAKAQCSDTFV